MGIITSAQFHWLLLPFNSISQMFTLVFNLIVRGFPRGPVVKNRFAKAGDTGSTPDSGRSHMPWSN